MIHLTIGNIEIDWGKNEFFTNHGQLFQQSDLCDVPYYYVDEDNPESEIPGKYNLITEYKQGISKTLQQVIERIELLGSKSSGTRDIFESFCEMYEIDPLKFTFEQFEKIFINLDINLLTDKISQSESFEDFLKRMLIDYISPEKRDEYYPGYYNEFIRYSPYSVLHLIFKNPSSKNLPVSWLFADVVENGWTTKDSIISSIGAHEKFLIVTEGSSDAKILKHALNILKPHIADFFTFVDMDEGYPFSGTGNLINFTKGLISISILNKVIILYDNDAEGIASYNKTNRLNIPANMKVLKLPDLPVFEKFKTIGPTGEKAANINGAAAAIECYLDTGSEATVRWTAYNKDLTIYQGELIEKRATMMNFLETKQRISGYDFSKIESVLDNIVEACTNM